MKVGNLVRHRRSKIYYLVVEVDNTALIGVVMPSSDEIQYIEQGWLEVI
jgi:hypothetical protein